MIRRHAFKRAMTGVLMLLSATLATHVCAHPTAPADRACTVRVLTHIGGPVLDALSKGELH
jgi:hypothetical protein